MRAAFLAGAALAGPLAAPAAGADSAVGAVFGFGASLSDWKFLVAALAFPILALVVVIVARRRERRREKAPTR